MTDNEPKFFCDRMVGSLCKYLRFMGYDTLSANYLPENNPREDTDILTIAKEEKRFILTRDKDLAQRGDTGALFLSSEDLGGQIKELIFLGLIHPVIRLNRCSLCNSSLIRIPADELSDDWKENAYPSDIMWCPVCKKKYWEGSHTRNLRKKLSEIMSR